MRITSADQLGFAFTKGAEGAKGTNAWVATVRAFVDWTCVCGKQHRVILPENNVRVCPQCQREWHVTMTGNVRISYQERVPVTFDDNGQLALFGADQQPAEHKES